MNDLERALRGRRAFDQAAAAAARLVERARADGLVDVAYARIDSPLGPLVAAVTDRGLVRLSYQDETEVLERLAGSLSPRILESSADLDDVRRELDEYFEGRRSAFEIPVDWALIRGFARGVLRATARIPFGEVATYRDVAERAGNPKASRAAGGALGSNPIPIVVPCHRVVRTGGALGGYAGGLERKEFLLRLEGAL